MSALLIRPVRLDDITTIHAIYSHNVLHGTASWELTPPDRADMLGRLQAVLDKGFPYFVAEIDGQVVGYCYASGFRPRPGYRFTVENSIYVTDGFQRRGIARQLMSTLIDACTTMGFRQMLAVIGDSANTPSIELHRSLGFVQVGLLPSIGFKFGRWLDSVWMQRSLGDGARTLPE